jgi:hypothetical protein
MAHKADNLTAICEPTVLEKWKPRRLTALWASTACYRYSVTFYSKFYRLNWIWWRRMYSTRQISLNKVCPTAGLHDRSGSVNAGNSVTINAMISCPRNTLNRMWCRLDRFPTCLLRFWSRSVLIVWLTLRIQEVQDSDLDQETVYLTGIIHGFLQTLQASRDSTSNWATSDQGNAVAQVVEALCYKLEGRGFDSWWIHWIFQFT